MCWFYNLMPNTLDVPSLYNNVVNNETRRMCSFFPFSVAFEIIEQKPILHGQNDVAFQMIRFYVLFIMFAFILWFNECHGNGIISFEFFNEPSDANG